MFGKYHIAKCTFVLFSLFYINVQFNCNYSMKKERERSPLSQEDENTQTSSPGGWQSKLAALNFLHLQVHRRGTGTSSRGSSRKSSRASDASDLSELAGPWLNLPMMLVSGTSDMKNGEGDDKR